MAAIAPTINKCIAGVARGLPAQSPSAHSHSTTKATPPTMTASLPNLMRFEDNIAAPLFCAFPYKSMMPPSLGFLGLDLTYDPVKLALLIFRPIHYRVGGLRGCLRRVDVGDQGLLQSSPNGKNNRRNAPLQPRAGCFRRPARTFQTPSRVECLRRVL